MKRTVLSFFFLLLLFGQLFAAGKQEDFQIHFVHIRNNDQVSLKVTDGFMQGAEEIGVEVHIQDSGIPGENYTLVENQTKNFIAMGIDAIFLTSVPDPAHLEELAELCESVGVPLITAYTPNLDTDPYQAGRNAVKLLFELINGKTSIPEEYRITEVFGNGMVLNTERTALRNEASIPPRPSSVELPGESSDVTRVTQNEEPTHIKPFPDPGEIAAESEKSVTENLEKETVFSTTQIDGKKYALVVGNSDYLNFGKLKNPVNDARDISSALKSRGFQVTTLLNTDLRNFEQTIRRLTSELNQDDVFLFYYSGHGIQSESINYLIPVGSTIDSEADLRYEAVEVDFLLSRIEDASPFLNIIILDACRNNPFRSGFRSASRGLAVVESPMRSMVIYATSPGKVAGDGDGENGVFTSSLLNFLVTNVVEINDLFRNVGKEVSGKTHNTQTPWIHSSFYDDFYF